MLCTSCAITYDTPKCELMLRGEPCLTNHACCNPPQTYYHNNLNYYGNWWYWNRPTYTNYVIIKPNNKPNKPNNRPNRPNNKPNNRSKKR